MVTESVTVSMMSLWMMAAVGIFLMLTILALIVKIELDSRLHDRERKDLMDRIMARDYGEYTSSIERRMEAIPNGEMSVEQAMAVLDEHDMMQTEEV